MRVLPYHGGVFSRQQALEAVKGWPSEPLLPSCYGQAARGEEAGERTGACTAEQQDAARVSGEILLEEGPKQNIQEATNTGHGAVGERSEL